MKPSKGDKETDLRAERKSCGTQSGQTPFFGQEKLKGENRAHNGNRASSPPWNKRSGAGKGSVRLERKGVGLRGEWNSCDFHIAPGSALGAICLCWDGTTGTSAQGGHAHAEMCISDGPCPTYAQRRPVWRQQPWALCNGFTAASHAKSGGAKWRHDKRPWPTHALGGFAWGQTLRLGLG